MAAFGISSTAGPGAEYIQRPEARVHDSLADLTDLIVIEGGKSRSGGSVHTRLLIQSSKWSEEQVARIKNATGPDSRVQIPLHYSLGAVQLFVGYIYSNGAIPQPETFAKHGIEACNLSRFLQSPAFRKFCERTLEYYMKSGKFRPTILDLQSCIRCELSKEVQDQMRENIVDRILEGKYEHSDDKDLIVSSTQEAIDAAIAQKMQARKRSVVNSEPAATTAPSSDHANTNNTSGGLFSNTQNQPPRQGGLFGNGPGLFGNNQNQTQTAGGLFGQPNQNTGVVFGNTHNQQQTSGSLFGSSASNGGGLFGNSQNQTHTSGSIFDQPSQSAGGLFGNAQNRPQHPRGLLNGPTQSGGSLFGCSQNRPDHNTSFFNGFTQNGGGLFGNNHNTSQSTGGLFGNTSQRGALFNNNTSNSHNHPPTSGGLFGNNNTSAQYSGGLSGNTSQTGGLFGNNRDHTQSSGSVFGNTGRSLFGINNHYPQPQQSNNGLVCGTPAVSGHFERPGTFPGLDGSASRFGNASNDSGGGFQDLFSPKGEKSNTNVHNNSDAFRNNTFGNTTDGFGGWTNYIQKDTTPWFSHNVDDTATGFGAGTGFGGNNNISHFAFPTNTGSVCTKVANPADHLPSWPKTSPCSCGKSNGNLLKTDTAYLIEKDAFGAESRYLHICFGDTNREFSPEELRLCNYNHHQKFGILETQEPVPFKLCDATTPDAELDILRARVNKLEQDASTLANKVYEMEKGKTPMTTKKERSSNVVSARGEHKKKPQFGFRFSTIAEDGSNDDENPETEVVKGDSNASTPAIVLTPTRSTTSSPSSATFANLTISDNDDFVNVEPSTATGKQNETIPTNNENSDAFNLEDAIWESVSILSPTARKVFAYLWTEHTVRESYFVLDIPVLSTCTSIKRSKVNDAITELVDAGVLHGNTEDYLQGLQTYSWGPNKI